MKFNTLLKLNTLFLISLMLSSCSRTPEIFTAGFGYGMFAMLAVLVVLAYLIMKARNK